jgi:Tfp pilus assembly protein PilX
MIKNAKKKKSQQGIVLIEAMLILPIILLIGHYGFQLSRYYQLFNMASSISREGARDSSRKCSNLIDPQTCLNNVYREVNTIARNMLPGSRLTLFVIEWKDTAPNKIKIVATAGTRKCGEGDFSYTGTRGGCQYKSLYQKESELAKLLLGKLKAGDHPSLMGNKNYVGISEVFYTYKSQVSNNILNKIGFPTDEFSEVYETTIY